MEKKQGSMAVNGLKKLDRKYLFTRFCSNTEVTVSELEQGSSTLIKMFTTVKLWYCHMQLMKPVPY